MSTGSETNSGGSRIQGSTPASMRAQKRTANGGSRRDMVMTHQGNGQTADRIRDINKVTFRASNDTLSTQAGDYQISVGKHIGQGGKFTHESILVKDKDGNTVYDGKIFKIEDRQARTASEKAARDAIKKDATKKLEDRRKWLAQYKMEDYLHIRY